MKQLRHSLITCFFLLISYGGYALNFYVTSTANAGAGTLRQAIADALANPGVDSIKFNLPGPSYTITTSADLTITSQVIIDGTSQPGWAVGQPIVDVYRAGGGDVFSLRAGSNGSTLKGLIIEGGNRAIYVLSSGTHTISGNFIGTNSTGTAQGTTQTQWSAVQIEISSNNIIGGPNPGDGNVIAGARETGLRFSGATNTGNIIIGNYIGTDKTGLVGLANGQNGIQVDGNTNFSNSKIGGAGDSANVISKNNGHGILFGGGTNVSNNISISGNYIGVDKTGNGVLGNLQNGMELNNLTNVNVTNNVISGNLNSGLRSSNSVGIVAKGNFIGVGKDGTTSIKNSFSGVNISGTNSGMVIGGINPGEGNIVANNGQSGIILANSTGSSVKGNLVYSNAQQGISLNTSNNGIIEGNKVGVLADGVTIAGNGQNGISVDVSSNVKIGGTGSLGNIISTSVAIGINVNNSPNPVIQGNIVEKSGQLGIRVNNSGPAVVKDNVSNGNGQSAIYIELSGNSVLTGNIVGFKSDGVTSVGNSGNGITITQSPNVKIGGTTPADRNVVGGVNGNGIHVVSGSDNVIIQGNYVGLNATGLATSGVGGNGINIESPGALIGGSVVGARNVVSGNQSEGVVIAPPGNNAVIKGNFLGLDKNGGGSILMGNRGAGLLLRDVTGVMVGGTTPVERNIASNNGYLNGDINTAAGSDGIRVLGGSNITIKGNWTGVDSTGLIPMGNRWGGISLNEVTNSVIGGLGPGEGNIASANRNEGIYIRGVGPASTGITVAGNLIGVGSDGVTPMGNEDYGINITTGTNTGHTIVGNTIAYTGKPSTSDPSSGNGGAGIIVGNDGQQILITQNSIFCNVLSIYLTATANETVPAPVMNYTDNLIATGTATPGNTVEIFGNPKTTAGSCNCQGEVYLGTTVADASGKWTYTHNLGASAANLTATQTTALKSTSTFSTCCTPPKITADPGDKTICPLGTTTFSATVTPGSNIPKYIWQEKAGASASFADITNGGVYSGATTTSLTITAAPVTMDKYEYRMIVFGCYPTDTSTVAILNISHPTIKVSGDTLVCIGNSTTLTASGVTAGSYLWTPSTYLNTTSGNTVISSPAATITYTLRGSDANGCIDSTKQKITVIAKPVLTITGDSTICQGETTTLTVSGANTYTWSPTATLNTGSGATVIANPVVTTTYTITGTVNASCVTTKTVKVTVNGLPAIKVTPDVSAVCPGETVTLVASGGTSYVWNAAPELNTTIGSTVIVTPVTSKSYLVTGSDGFCTNTAQGIVNIKSNIAVKIKGKSFMCEGQSEFLTATGASSYTWTPNTGLTVVNDSVMIAAPNVTTKYVVTGTKNSCTGKDSIFFAVYNLPVITLSADTFYTCLGDSVQLTGTSDGFTYAWSPTTNLTQSNILEPKTFPTTNTKYVVTAFNKYCSRKDSAIVVVNPLPVIVSPDQVVCSGDSAILTASGAQNYVWSPATYLDKTVGSSVQTKPSTDIIYTITGSDAKGCVNTKQVKITTLLAISISVNPPGPICAGQTATLTASGANKFVWSPATALDRTDSSVVKATPVATITYKVVGSANTCKDSANVTVTVNTVPVLTVPNDTTFCSGGTTNIKLTAPNAPTATYSWTAVNSGGKITGFSNGTTGPISQTLKNTGTIDDSLIYTLIATANNCTSAPVKVKATVRGVPDVVITGNNSICKGSSTNIITNGATSYAWSPNADLTVVSPTEMLVKPNATTKYIVTGTKNGCPGIDSVTITVKSLPVVTLSADTFKTCAGDSIQITGTSDGAAFSWSPSAGLGKSNILAPKALPSNSITKYIITAITNGCSTKDSAIVKVNALPVLTANDKFICTGDSAYLKVSGAQNYVWSPSIYLNKTTGDSVLAKPQANTTYTIIGTDVNGCKNSKTIDVTTLKVTVSVNPLNPAICEGSSTSLTASGATTYSWTPSTGLNTNVFATVTASPTDTTVYKVIGTTSGCRDTATVTVIVNAVPIITDIPDTSFCSGGTTSIKINAPNTPGASYSWLANLTGGQVSGMSANSGNTISQTLNNTGIIEGKVTYTLKATSNNCPAVPVDVEVKVYPAPVIIPPATTTICYNATSDVTLASNISTATYAWNLLTADSFVNGYATNGTGNKIKQTLTNSDSIIGKLTYNVVATNTVGTLSCPGIAVPVTIKVNPLPTYSVITDTICSGEKTNVLFVPDVPGTTYTWTYNPAGAVVTPSSQVTRIADIIKTIAQTDGIVTYSVTSHYNNCDGPVQGVDVLVHPLPQPVITANDTLNFCDGGSVKLTASPQGTHTWQDGIIRDSLRVTSSGSFYTNLVDVNGCMGQSNIVKVNVYDNPTIDLEDSMLVCMDESVDLGMSPVIGYIYSWTSSTKHYSASEANPVFVARENQTLKVVVSNKGCTAVDSVKIKLLNESDIYIPNAFSPNEDGVNDKFKVITSNQETFKATIFNRWGEIIYEWDNPEDFWNGKVNDELVQQSVYVYKVSAKDKCHKTTELSGTVTLLK